MHLAVVWACARISVAFISNWQGLYGTDFLSTMTTTYSNYAAAQYNQPGPQVS